MKYYEITIMVSELGIEPTLAALICEGIDTAEVNDPLDAAFMSDMLGETDYLAPEDFDKESGKEPSIVVYAPADSEDASKEVFASVKRAVAAVCTNASNGVYGEGVDLGSLDIIAEVRDDDEWKDRWKEFIRPAGIGNDFVVAPPWIDMNEYADEFKQSREVISINPGMAFGTGLHETTSLSADLLLAYTEKGARVIDVGCGTGILSIIASRLGASDVLGIDIDKDAVAAANENLELNDVRNVTIKQGDLTEGLDYKADIVVANLLTNLVIRLTADVRKHLNDGGIYIMSGILISQEEKVLEKLRANGFKCLEIAEQGEWCGIAAQLKK